MFVWNIDALWIFIDLRNHVTWLGELIDWLIDWLIFLFSGDWYTINCMESKFALCSGPRSVNPSALTLPPTTPISTRPSTAKPIGCPSGWLANDVVPNCYKVSGFRKIEYDGKNKSWQTGKKCPKLRQSPLFTSDCLDRPAVKFSEETSKFTLNQSLKSTKTEFWKMKDLFTRLQGNCLQ